MEELIKIQAQLKVPKKNRNSFGGYNYRSCEDILEAVKPLCAENKCFINVCDEVIEIGGRIYIKATASIYNTPGQRVSSTAYAREEETKKGMDAAQITGSASSYARKYALNGLLAIDDTKDPDSEELSQATKKAERKTITSAQLDNEETKASLLKWAYPKLGDDLKANAGELLAKHYEISDQIRNRFSAMYIEYIKNR
jgi:hypothetical protein